MPDYKYGQPIPATHSPGWQNENRRRDFDKCLDVVSRNIQFAEKIPEDFLEKTLAYVKAFF